MFYHGGSSGVHLVISRDSQKHLADVFVLDLPGPRSAYFVPAIHASMLHPIQVDRVADVSPACATNTVLAPDTSSVDYGGWIEEELSLSKRTGCSPFKAADIPNVRNGHISPPAKPPSFGQTLRVSSAADGSSFNAMLLGFMDPPSGRVYAHAEVWRIVKGLLKNFWAVP